MMWTCAKAHVGRSSTCCILMPATRMRNEKGTGWGGAGDGISASGAKMAT